MNNHRPRKTMVSHNTVGMSAGQYMSTIPNSSGFYNTANSADHAREINKVGFSTLFRTVYSCTLYVDLNFIFYASCI